MCTGLLPAAALAAASDVNHLLKLSIEILSVVFRLTVEMIRRSSQIEEAPGCWAYVITGASADEQQDIIDDFHRKNVSH